jgi:uncharacterized protein YegP (UPF0339 family)
MLMSRAFPLLHGTGNAALRSRFTAVAITLLCQAPDTTQLTASLTVTPSTPQPKDVEMAHKFEIYKDKAGEFRVRFKYNSETIFSTEGYSSKASAQNAIDSIKKNGPGAPTEDNS